MKRKIIISILCIILPLVSLIVVYKYPVGDWVSSPLIIKYILLPILIIEIILFLLLQQIDKPKLFLTLQITFAALALLITMNYIRVH